VEDAAARGKSAVLRQRTGSRASPVGRYREIIRVSA
jgi:hypothetical protein